MRRRLLYLNTHRLSAYAWQAGQLRLEGSFDSNEAGWREFADYLATHAGDHYALLANVAEEGHQLETIPFLQGADRQALITRKIGQHFLGTPLATATSLGYEKTQRKNEKLLLSALTNPGHFEPWLQRIQQVGIALSGIYSVAQLGGQLLGKLGLGGGRSLLLTLQDHSIRESYLIDGHVHFSRMAPLTDSSIGGIARSFAAEAGKLHQYLLGQRLIGRDDTLPVFIVAHPHSVPAIEQSCPDREHLAFTIIDNQVAAGKLKLQTPPEDNRCDPLFLQLLAAAPPRQQFACEDSRHHYRLSQIRHGLIATGLIVLLAGGLFAAKNAFDAHELRLETGQLQASGTDLDQRYREISATFPQLGVDNDTLRQLTGRFGEIVKQQRLPDPVYRQISQVLDRMPAVILENIDWKNGRFFRSTVANQGDDREVTTIKGSIRLERASTRQTLAEFDRFVDALASDPATSVKVVQRPFQIESAAALRGGDDQEDDARQRPFIVEIVRQATQ